MENPKDMKDPEQVAALLAALQSSERRAERLAAENASIASDMAAMAASMSAEIERLRRELAESQGAFAGLVEQIKLLNQQHYGSRSEKVVAGQLSLFNDIEAAADDGIPEPAVEDMLPKRKRRHGGKRVIDYSRFETVVIEHGMEDGACPACGSPLEQMGTEITRRIRIVPAHLVVEEHRRRTYRCAACCADNARGGDSKGVIVRAPMPAPPIPHSFATPSLIAWLINGKYSNSLPLYRMEAELKSLGAPISRQNMANWILGCHERWFSRIYGRMRSKLLALPRMHADETVVQVLREPGRDAKQKSRMWLFCSAACDTPIYIFRYDETRSKRVARDFLEGWSGTLTTDGYRPYFNLGMDGIVNVACGVHIRRYFANIVKSVGGDAKAEACASVALEARRRIDEIFRIDSRFDGMEPDERKAARERELRPLMEAFLPWAKARLSEASPRLALHRALDYAVEFWPYFMNVLSDGHLELDNNIAERAQRPFVIGRKNWLFSDTPRGAEASAAIYSIVTTARANGLNPRLYIEWLLAEMPNAGLLDGDTLDGFLPWSEKVPQSCRLAPEKAAEARDAEDDPILAADPDIENDECQNNLRDV